MCLFLCLFIYYYLSDACESFGSGIHHMGSSMYCCFEYIVIGYMQFHNHYHGVSFFFVN